MTTSKRYETTVVAIMFMTWGTVFLDRMAQLYLAPFMSVDLRLAPKDIGLLAAVMGGTWAFSTFVFGALSDRVGRRVILIPMVFAFSALSIASGLVRTFPQLLLVRALMGIAEGPCWSIMNVIVARVSHPTRRGRNVGFVLSAASIIGLAVAPVLTTQVAARYGWRFAFFLAGLPGLGMGLLIWKYVKEPPLERASPDMPTHRLTLRDMLALVGYRNLRLCAVGATGFMGWLFLTNVFGPLYITKVAGQSGTSAGFLLGAAGLGSVVIGFLASAMSDRFGPKMTLLVASTLSMLLPLTLVYGHLYDHLWILAGILFLTQGGQAVATLMIVLLPTATAPRAMSGAAIGLVTLTGELFGATLGPVLGGHLAEAYGLAAPLLLAAACMALAFFAALRLEGDKL